MFLLFYRTECIFNFVSVFFFLKKSIMITTRSNFDFYKFKFSEKYSVSECETKNDVRLCYHKKKKKCKNDNDKNSKT